MQRVTEQVDAAYLEQAPPRPMPAALVLNLLNDCVFDQPLKRFLSPLLIAGLLALAVLFALGAGRFVRLIPVALIAAWMVLEARAIWHCTRANLELLRDGLTVRAHVLGLRPYRATSGAIDGALLDCAIPVRQRRTYVGSVWLSNGAEAQRLLGQGRVLVLCLPRAPGTWRVIEQVQADIRYDRLGPIQALPREDEAVAERGL